MSVFPLDRGAGSNKEANKSYLRMVFLFTLVAPFFERWFGVNNKSIQFRPNNQVLFAWLIIEGEGGGRVGGQIAKLHFLEILAPTAFVACQPQNLKIILNSKEHLPTHLIFSHSLQNFQSSIRK